jgi:nitrogenase molybdenum-iron protein alpha/beta subunit
MSQTITLRLPDETAKWLKDWARRAGRSVNELGTTLFEEARRMTEFAEIEFRTFNGERHACIKGQLQVWQLIMVARDYGMDIEKTAAHFGWPAWKVQAGINYYEAFPEEIDRAIAENNVGPEKLKRLFPHLQVIDIKIPPDEEKGEEAGS